jgi:hypothetical protein
MKTRVGIVHATMNAVSGVTVALAAHAPELEPLHFVDEGLIVDLPADGSPGPERLVRLQAMFVAAAASGARAILLTCSAYSPFLPSLRAAAPVSVVGIDDAMLGEAVARAQESVGIVATLEAAGPTTALLLTSAAKQAGKVISIENVFVPDAFGALKAGESERHDRLVRDAVQDLCSRHDVVILAQISMARAVTGPTAPKWPQTVLTSAASSVLALSAAAHASRP